MPLQNSNSNISACPDLATQLLRKKNCSSVEKFCELHGLVVLQLCFINGDQSSCGKFRNVLSRSPSFQFMLYARNDIY